MMPFTLSPLVQLSYGWTTMLALSSYALRARLRGQIHKHISGTFSISWISVRNLLLVPDTPPSRISAHLLKKYTGSVYIL